MRAIFVILSGCQLAKPSGIYSELYSTQKHGPDLIKMENDINNNVGHESIADVGIITLML